MKKERERIRWREIAPCPEAKQQTNEGKKKGEREKERALLEWPEVGMFQPFTFSFVDSLEGESAKERAARSGIVDLGLNRLSSMRGLSRA